MKTLRIINHGTGDYTVEITHLGNHTEEKDFDDHSELTDFVQDMKDAGYAVANDLY